MAKKVSVTHHPSTAELVFSFPPSNSLLIDGVSHTATARNHVGTMMMTIQRLTNADPLPALRRAIELAAPQVKLVSQKKHNKNIPVPRALSERQRVWKAIKGIASESEKQKDKRFGVRLGMEVTAVVNGVSGLLRKKEEVHKLATANRSNLRTWTPPRR
jgi:small subunit ribosomal protein S7